jgi:shikimate 5-dehydrogenase
MLVAQGAQQFKLWTGKDAPTELMQEAILSQKDRRRAELS